MRWLGLALAVSVCSAMPAMAQDLNVLDRHLEHQRWQRLQDHQTRSRTMKARKPLSGQASGLARCTEDHVPRPDYRRMEAEYGRRLQADGKTSADRWSHQQRAHWLQRLKQQGVCR